MKYPKTYHLNFSPGRKNKPYYLDRPCWSNGIVATVKMDGENTSLYRSRVHARSEDSGHHESRSYVKRFWSNISYKIPESYQCFVENLYAKHSIQYDNLPSYVIGFAVYDHKVGEFLSFRDTKYFFESVLSIPCAYLVYKGDYEENRFEDLCYTWFKDVEYLYGESEGIVVRPVGSFSLHDFPHAVAKYVRQDHVKTGDHWMYQQVERNNLIL